MLIGGVDINLLWKCQSDISPDQFLVLQTAQIYHQLAHKGICKLRWDTHATALRHIHLTLLTHSAERPKPKPHWKVGKIQSEPRVMPNKYNRPPRRLSTSLLGGQTVNSLSGSRNAGVLVWSTITISLLLTRDTILFLSSVIANDFLICTCIIDQIFSL